MFENKYIQQRIEKADKLREAFGINIFKWEFKKLFNCKVFLNVNSDIEQYLKKKRDENSRVYIVAGRIKFFRLMGKASF